MNAATPVPALPEPFEQAAHDDFPTHDPSSWTCYSAGAYTTEWVARAAEDSSAPSDVLSMLAESCNVEVRMAVADNRNTLLETLMMLAQDDSDDLRYQLAENHNIDKRILNLLIDDSNPYIVHRAQKTLARLKACATNVVQPLFKPAVYIRHPKVERA